MNDFGQLHDVFTTDEINKWVSILKMVNPVVIRENYCHGVDEKNTNYYTWFQKNIFCRIQQMFGNDLVLLFGMFLVENKPWGIHTDAYHTKTRPGTIPAYSFLIPYSVDFDTRAVRKSQTIVFNEMADDNDELDNFPDKSHDLNCALKIYHDCLSHNQENRVKKITIGQQCHWEPNSLIYWRSRLLHDSDNFLVNGHTSKQAIVIHTAYKI